MRKRARLARLGATLATLGAVAAVPFAASPSSAAPHLTFCSGVVTHDEDGDTVSVRLTTPCPGGQEGHILIVRNAGIQATEVSHGGSTPDCWSAQGQAFVRHLIPKGTRVRLSSYGATLSPETERGHVRYIKYVDVHRNGRWIDVQRAEIRAGDAMYKSEPIETAHLNSYLRAEEAAMHAHVGMWGHPAECSSAYDQGAQLKAWIVWKTNGPDRTASSSEEAFNVRNQGSSTVDLSHWLVRNASRRIGHGTIESAVRDEYEVLPGDIFLPPGQTLHLHPSHGTNDPATFDYYNNGRNYVPSKSGSFFPNAPMARGGPGAHLHGHAEDGTAIFLLDPAENFRAWASYPCLVDCGMPANLSIWANPGVDDHGREFVEVTNHEDHAVSLLGDVVDMDGFTKNLSGHLAANATLTIYCQGDGTSTPTVTYWNDQAHQLPNAGGTIWLRTANDTTISIYRWGNHGRYDYRKD